jgi:hypothetical protein
MCTVSYIGDGFMRNPPMPAQPWIYPVPGQAAPSREEFDALRREMEALKELLKAAKKYDEQTGQPDCEQEDKIALLKRLAELVGVDLSEVFPAGDAQ